MERQAEGLAARGCRVEVLVQRASGDRELPAVERRPSGVVVRRFASIVPSRRFPVAPLLARYLRAHGDHFDVVHGHSFHSAPAVLAALVADRPFVCTPHFHGTGHTPLARLVHVGFRPLAQRALDRCHAVLCVSEVERSVLGSVFRSIEDKAVVLPNGVDDADFGSAVALPVAEPVVLVAGRLEAYKGVDVVLAAFGSLAGPARLVVVGDGPERSRLERQAVAAGLHGRVTFAGRVERSELCRWHRTAHVLVTLSSRESFGLVALEGLAAGARVVASDIPAHREVTRRWGADVRLVAPDITPAALAGVLADELSRPRPDRPCGGLPTWDQQVEGCLAIYRQAAAAGSGARRGVRPR